MNMAKDPICGMEVNPKKARFKIAKAGKTYYFCSKNCYEKFLNQNKPSISKKTLNEKSLKNKPIKKKFLKFDFSLVSFPLDLKNANTIKGIETIGK